ncbi:hypothetical protein [Clostridium sp.]|uniref:hypothetical protein n=1 Tax=Clostridium sp. TaxID=1506 RepID=UPI003D6D0224
MNLIDLREFESKIDKIIPFDDTEFIFSTTECEKEDYKRYFYKYNMKNKHFCRINKIGIDTYADVYYNNYILNNCIYTNSYKVKYNGTETFMSKVNLIDGKIDKIYSIEKDVTFIFIFISERYLLLNSSNCNIDEEHFDVKKDIQGEYDYAILCDLKEKKEYEIKDKRVVLGTRDYFISYIVDSKIYIVFEEAYMEDYELEDMFKERIKKEDFYKSGYRESINVIPLDKFVESVQEGCEIIPFNQIHKTEITSWTRYFGMDEKNIYYRVKDFESKIQYIYSINKKTLEKQLLKSIQMDNSELSFLNYSIWYDKDNRKIYETKVIDDNTKEVKEIMHEDFTFKYDGIKEEFEGLIENHLITSYWIEEDNGYDYKNFVKVQDTKSGTIDTYEGVCTIIKDNIILFI